MGDTQFKSLFSKLVEVKAKGKPYSDLLQASLTSRLHAVYKGSPVDVDLSSTLDESEREAISTLCREVVEKARQIEDLFFKELEKGMLEIAQDKINEIVDERANSVMMEYFPIKLKNGGNSFVS